MRFVRYNGQIAIVVQNGRELCAQFPGSDLEDHLGLWYAEVNTVGRPIVYTIPAEYVDKSETVDPEYQH